MESMKKESYGLRLAPEVFITIVLVLAPFLGGKRDIIGTGLLAIVAFASVIALVWCRQLLKPTAFWPFSAFLILIALSAVVTVCMHATLYQIMYFSACAAVALVASSAYTDKKWSAATLYCLIVVGVILSVTGISEYARSSADWRIFGPFESPGYFGGYLVLIIPVLLAAVLAFKPVAAKVASTLVWALAIAALFLTGTRFAIISVGIASIAFVALAAWTRNLNRQRSIWLIIAAAVAIGAASLANAPTASRMAGKAATEQSHSLPFRVATWKGTANIIKAHPLIGTGVGTFELVFQKYMVAGYTRMAHNGYLQVASESGILSLIALAVAFGALFLAGLKGLRRDDENEPALFSDGGSALIACGLAAAIIGSLARNLMDSDLYNPGIGLTFWAFAGLIASRMPSRKTISLPSVAKIGITALAAVMSVLFYMFMLGDMHSSSAETAIFNGDAIFAMDEYRAATKVDPLLGEHWLHLGQLEVATSQGDESQWVQGTNHIRKAAHLEPTRARNYIVLGRILSDHSDKRGAVDAFRKALDADPHATPAMLAVAQLLSGTDAEAMYKRLLDEEKSPTEQLKGVPELVNPDFAWAHYYFGKKSLSEGHWSDAAEHFSEAVGRLEKRKSYGKFLAAAKEAGMNDPEQESALDGLLSDSQSRLAEARSHILKDGGQK